MKNLIAFLLIFTGIAGALIFAHEKTESQQFAQSEKTKATVTAISSLLEIDKQVELGGKLETKSIVVHYSFDVSGVTYTNRATHNFNAHPVGKGDPIDVEYVKENPSINRPVSSLSEGLFTWGIVSFLLLATLGVALALWPARP